MSQIIGTSDKSEIPKIVKPTNRYQRSFKPIPIRKLITANPDQVIVRNPGVASDIFTLHQRKMAIELHMIMALCICGLIRDEFLIRFVTC